MLAARFSKCGLPVASKRFMSSTIPHNGPSKDHLHRAIPDDHFPKGYAVNGLHVGVKKSKDALDLALIASTSARPTNAAAVFTRNAFKAAPVLASEDVLRSTGGRGVRALIVNSGCANAVTGQGGLDDAWAMVRFADRLSSTPGAGEDGPHSLVMSTGVIGQRLPIARMLGALEAGTGAAGTFDASFGAWERAARAFMTTDTFPKLRARTFEIRGRQYRMAGMDKGAGMIHPNMGPSTGAGAGGALHATLLGCVLTDAAVSPRSLQSALNYAVDRSFNAISVDGDMSTNDTIVIMANGAAAPEGESAAAAEIDETTDPEAYAVFRDELTELSKELAQLVVRDGEGATKFVTVSVEGAPTYQDAHAVASRISTSALVKTALFGQDANWGRILAATGSVPLSKPIDPTRVNVSFVSPVRADFAPLPVLVNGEPEQVDEEQALKIISEEDIEIKVELGLGTESAKYWTCDLSYEYVRINGDYRS